MVRRNGSDWENAQEDEKVDLEVAVSCHVHGCKSAAVFVTVFDITSISAAPQTKQDLRLGKHHLQGHWSQTTVQQDSAARILSERRRVRAQAAMKTTCPTSPGELCKLSRVSHSPWTFPVQTFASTRHCMANGYLL
eukprot:3058607-Rhodomonas_salina.2